MIKNIDQQLFSLTDKTDSMEEERNIYLLNIIPKPKTKSSITIEKVVKEKITVNDENNAIILMEKRNLEDVSVFQTPENSKNDLYRDVSKKCKKKLKKYVYACHYH